MVVKCRDRRDRRKKEMLVGRRRYRGQFHNLFSIVVERRTRRPELPVTIVGSGILYNESVLGGEGVGGKEYKNHMKIRPGSYVGVCLYLVEKYV